MINRQKTITIILVAIFITGFVAFRPNLWQNRIEIYLNRQLNKEGWTVNINKLSGHLFSNIYTDNISLINENGTSVILPKISAKIMIFQLLRGKIKLSTLSLSNASIYPFSDELNDKEDKINKLNFLPERMPINIDNLHADGSIFTSKDDSTIALHFLIDGAVKPDTNALNINLSKFELFYSNPRIDIVINNIKGNLSSKRISVDIEKANINSFPLGGHFEYEFGNVPKMNGEIALLDYNIPNKIFSQFPLQPELSKISATFKFESDLKHFIGGLNINNDLGLEMSGDFNLENKDDYFQLHSISLKGNEATLNIKGLYEKNGHFNGRILLEKLDVSEWITKGKNTNLSGYILLDGDFNKDQISALDMNVEVDESILFEKEASSISGGISYRDYKLQITNPLTLTIGPSIIEVNGFFNFDSKFLDLNLSLTEASTFLINNFWEDSLSSGLATGYMYLNGQFDSLGIDADLRIDNFGYNDISLKSFEFIGNIENLNSFSEGSFKLKFGKGYWNDYGIESGTGEFILQDTFVEVSSFELKNGDDYFQFNGSVNNDSLINLERFQIAYRGHYLINPRPISILYSNDNFLFEPFEVHVDDGILEGSIATNPLKGHIKFSNVTADIISLFESNYSQKIKGNIFGEISIDKDLNDNIINLDLTLKNGELAKQSFDNFYVSALYKDEVIFLKEIYLTDGEETSFKARGSFPLLGDSKRTKAIDLQSNFNNIDLRFFTQFIPKWEPYVFGKYTGTFNISGSTKKTLMNIEASINDAIFRKIPLGLVKFSGLYKSKKLVFNNFSSKWNGNYINGTATLPIDFDFGSPNINKWNPNGEIIVNTNGTFNSLVFLSENLTEMDSITGDISINLDINGPKDLLVRNGNINIKNGKIHTILIDEPIRNIYASAELKQNKMSINSFNGTLFDSNNKIIPENNLSISGIIDFTKFFEPRYNINALGKDVFFRSLDGDIEAYSDVDVSIIGKDTINVSGSISARNGAIYSEFNTDSKTSFDKKGRTTTNYNLRFPIQESFAIRNSQIDAIISGEIAMNRENDSGWNYSGEIELMEGEIYYYLGDVFKNLRGSMTMDGQGFNPFLDLTASTRIGDAEIMLGVFGPFDNPEWTFNSDKGYTESDILQLLTFNTRVAEEGFTTEGLGSQAQTILGAYLERQLERNFVRATGLQSSGIIEDVEISGTSELIKPGQGEEFSISAKVNRNFSLSYQRSFSLEAAYQNKVGVEYKLNPNFSVIGNVDEKGQVHMKFRVRRVY